MTIRLVLERLGAPDRIPVHVDEILSAVRAHTPHDEISIYFVPDIDEGKVRGFCRQYTISSGVYGDSTLHSDVVIANDQSLEWQRLVAAKELIHVLEGNGSRVSTNAELDKFLSIMAAPIDVAAVSMTTIGVATDLTGVIPALALLVPQRFREKFREDFRIGKITEKEIAQICAIPDEYVDFLMGDLFEEALDLACKLAEEGNLPKTGR